MAIQRFVNVIKSPEDNRSYRALILENQMKVLLVSDSTTDKSAASLDVQVGHLSDPDELPGLAHFCEHMLFLGTEKYPIENEYSKFLAEHGGSFNACTFTDHTNYYFDVKPESIRDALERFAQFFISPLFTESAVGRECNAVNSEHDKNIAIDSRRLHYLDKHTANPKHAFHKFGTGNKQTLEITPKEKGINVRDELLKFHDTWYSSNIMVLTILGKENLDELEEMAVKLFSSVKNKNVAAPTWPEAPFTAEQYSTCLSVVPIKDSRQLYIVFPIPDLIEHYKSAPCEYISHLVGHEGPGSILSALKERGWAISLMSNGHTSARGFGFFTIYMDLTEEGLENTNDIVKLVLQYLNILRENGLQKWIYDENKELFAMNFRFKDKESPFKFISRIVHKLHKYPIEEVLSGPYLITEWKPEIIQSLLNDFVPEKMRIAVVSQTFEGKTDKTEPWYGVEYKLEKIHYEKLQEWRNCGFCNSLKLPEKNEFIPSNFDLFAKEEVSEYPVVIKDSDVMRVWYKQDDEYKLPKANIDINFVSPLLILDPTTVNLTYMFVELFEDSLNEYSYSAKIAGLNWALKFLKYGLVLKIGGYNDKQYVLLEKIIDKLVNFEIDPKRFEIMKEKYVRSLRNFKAEMPYEQVIYYLSYIMTENTWDKTDLLSVADQISLDQLKLFIDQFLSKMHLEVLAHGNIKKQDMLKCMNLIEDKLKPVIKMKLFPQQMLLRREIKLKDDCNFVYNMVNGVHKSSCIEIYYQCFTESKENNNMLQLFAQIINEPCFNILRTKEQLGYIVFSGVRKSSGVQGLRVIVQSDRHPRYVDSRIEEFLLNIESSIENISDEEFTKHVEALATKKLERPKGMSGLTSKFWDEITNQQYHFNRENVEVEYLRTIKKEDVLKFYKEFISVKSNGRRKIAVHLLSTVEQVVDELKPSEKTKNIVDVVGFKSCHEMNALPTSYIDIAKKGSITFALS